MQADNFLSRGCVVDGERGSFVYHGIEGYAALLSSLPCTANPTPHLPSSTAEPSDSAPTSTAGLRAEFRRPAASAEEAAARLDFAMETVRWLSAGNMCAQEICSMLEPRTKAPQIKYSIGDILWHKEYGWRGPEALVLHASLELSCDLCFIWSCLVTSFVLCEV
jgi:hypothetical protein